MAELNFFKTDNAKAFRRKMQEWGRDRVPAEITLFQRKVAIDALARVVMKTPVGNPSKWKNGKALAGYVGGTARGNWQIEIGKIPDKILARIAKGGEAIEAEVNKLVGLGKYQVIYIINNVPYIIPLEHGSSSQSPQGMVSLTITELGAIF